MTPEASRPEAIFAAALDIADRAARSAYLDRTCGADSGLRQEVEMLLAAHVGAEAGDFMGQQPTLLAEGLETVLSAAREEQAGDRIDRYKLLEPIGEGGFGVVWMAEQQEPVRRRVALKVIKLGMDTKQVTARFEAERQALALMDHPNIARVFDGGATVQGRPYFVMELIKGVPITTYCDEQKLDPRQRLELFIQVCHGVQHAHQKGIIHRDLKPSNILVAVHDDKPVPKIIDFGIAKATQQPLTDQTVFTRFQQLIGTPAYMSPEQAGMSSLDVDTRSDIYSLGVLLYELLTGRTPFSKDELLKAGFEEMCRVIREKEPPKPSTRLSTLTAEELGTVASRRQLAPEKLGRLVRGELDWIVLKALEKDRARRYETANGFARDIERYLNQEPVSAVAPSLGYQLAKFARRNRAALTTATALAVLLVAGLVASLWQAVRATRAERRERSEAATSRQVATFLREMLEGVEPGWAMGRDQKLLREILDLAANRIETGMQGQPEVEVELRLTLGEAYAQLGEYAKAEATYRRALTIRRKLLGGEHPEVATSLHDLAGVLKDQGRRAEAEAMNRQVLRMRKRLLGDQHPEIASSLNSLALLLEDQGGLAEAEAMLREAMAMQMRFHGPQHEAVAGSLIHLGRVLMLQGKLLEAETIQREALAMQRKLHGDQCLCLATSLSNLGETLKAQGKRTEAETVLRQALALRRKLFGHEHPYLAASLNNLAVLLQGPEAETMHREALAMRKKFRGLEHEEVAESLHNLAQALRAQGKMAEAETMQREALTMLDKLLGHEHPHVALSLIGLAAVLRAQNKLAEAETTQREALAMRKQLLGPEHPEVAKSLSGLASLLEEQGKLAEAETMGREALTMQKKLLGPEHEHVAKSLSILAAVFQAQGKSAEAETMGREALAMQKKLLGLEHMDVVVSLHNLTMALDAQGKLTEAETVLRDALALLRRLRGNEHADVATFLNELVGLLLAQGKLLEAESMIPETVSSRLHLAGTSQDRVVALLTEAIQKSSEDSDACFARGSWFGRRGEWRAAVSDFSQVVKLTADLPCFALAPLLVETGDTASYRSFRRSLLTRASGCEDPPTAAATAMSLLLQPADSVLAIARGLANLAVTQGTNHARLPYFRWVQALAEYRQGRSTSAIEWAARSLAHPAASVTDAVAAQAVLAMAQHQLKQSDPARQALAQAMDWSETKLPKLESGDLGEDWSEWLVARILLREASTLINGPPDVRPQPPL